MQPIKVEVGQYREVNKGAWKATFSLVIYPEGQKILDCRYFIQDSKRWFSFPQKEIKYTDGRKNDYIPLVSYLNKDYLEQLKSAVLNALKDAKSEVRNGQTQNQSYPRQANSIQAQPPVSEGELPF
jgi:hypothetical protein